MASVAELRQALVEECDWTQEDADSCKGKANLEEALDVCPERGLRDVFFNCWFEHALYLRKAGLG